MYTQIYKINSKKTNILTSTYVKSRTKSANNAVHFVSLYKKSEVGKRKLALARPFRDPQKLAVIKDTKSRRYE